MEGIDTVSIQSPNKLDKKKHIEKLIEGLTQPLSSNYEKLVPSQTWCVYWITHSLSLLEQTQFLGDIYEDVIGFIQECAHNDGGYGGGPGQIAHLATTFAAINALITTSNDEALDSIDRVNLVKFLHRLKQPDGSFAMHDDGEIDSRATYCALAILRCLNIQDSILLENVTEWILSCQTYEGGFGSVPGSEAHGGYTFCCVASLCLLNQLRRADMKALLRWLTNKQMSADGGFCGRSNKLVDSCYSYWQGAVFALIHPILIDECSRLERDTHSEKTSQSNVTTSKCRPNTRSSSATINKQQRRDLPQESDESNSAKLLDNWLFDCGALQDYVLNQCQSKNGMLRDKVGCAPDFYHTCYALSGLSLSQHQFDGKLFDIGDQPINELGLIEPIFNLTPSSLEHCFEYFKNKRIQTLFEKEEGEQDGSRSNEEK